MGKVKPDSARPAALESAESGSPTPSKPPKRPSRRAPARGRESSRPKSAKAKGSKAPPVKKKRRPSKQPPSLPPLELSDSFFPDTPPGRPTADQLKNPNIPPHAPPPNLLGTDGEPPPRPAPALPRPPGVAPAVAHDDPFGDLASELDERFAASLLPSSIPTTPPTGGADAVTTVDDLETVRQLFSEMAVPFMRQVRDFMLELRHTDASTSWIDLCEPALQSLRATCEQLEAPELAAALDEYVDLLQSAKSSASGRVGGELRSAVLACYDRMTGLLPEAFEVSGGREPIIVQLLLLQVPGVHKRTVQKLYAAGINHLDAFLNGKPEELASVSGIEIDLAARIVAKFRDYRRRVSSLVVESVPDEERDHLAGLVTELRDQDEAYERARAGWSREDIASKRRLRRARGQNLKEIYVVLARLGEVERIDELQRLPVKKQIELLEEFLEAAAGASVR